MYTAANACVTIKQYFVDAGLSSNAIEVIPGTKERGLVVSLPNSERAVVFIYPLVHKLDNTKNYFDTRDSGPHERAKAWNYALANQLKYFCLGVNDQVPKYNNYLFSLECTEREIERLSGTVSGDRSSTVSGNQIIIPNSYVPDEQFERITNNLGTFIAVIHKNSLVDSLEKYDNRPYLADKDFVPEQAVDENGADDNNGVSERGNILLYGVPGAGKSFTVNKDYIKDSENVERVVFHPDYTYSDFVGQILPVVHDDKSVSYEFVAGPFTRILKASCADPDNHYWLVIEEINRGNAPAIFGDLFQLLDRKEDGTSEYEITNADIAKVVFDDHEHKVGLPGNLSIIATMNTSDQNVFTLDTAFQRRWRMRLIDNDFDACEDIALMTSQVLDTGVQWKDFGKEINKRIVEANSGNMISTADKQLGTHFVSKNELEQEDVFAEKVLKYLWDDAVKMNPEQIFSPEYKELRTVIKDFKDGKGPEKLDVFNKMVRKALQTIIDGLNDGAFDPTEDVDGSEDT